MKKVIVFLSFLLLSCSLPEPRDIIPPVVRVIFPYTGAVISDNVQFTIEASDNDQVEEVWVYVDGQEIGRATSSPYKINFNIQGYEKKITHVMMAAARDKEGNMGFSATIDFVIADGKDNVDPTVVILNPQSGQTVEGIVKVVAEARDDRSIQEVRFYIDGELKSTTSDYPYMYNWNTTNYSDSTSHTIYAEAIDGGNNHAFSPVVTVTVFPRTGPTADNTPPHALFLYPIAGQTVTDSIDVSVDLRDNVKVTKAEFYVDGKLTEQADNPPSPWIFNWNTATVADTVPTLHSLYVIAYDRRVMRAPVV